MAWFREGGLAPPEMRGLEPGRLRSNKMSTQQRLLLAFLLSFLVLFAWNILSPPPAPKVARWQAPPIEKIFVKESAENSVKVEEQEKGQGEEFFYLENERIKAKFSTKGGALDQVYLKTYDTSLPVTGIWTLAGSEQLVFRKEREDDRQIVFVYQNGHFKVTKTYTLQDNFLITGKISLERLEMSNLEGMSILEYPKVVGLRLDISKLDQKNKEYDRDKTLFEYAVAYNEQAIYRKGSAFKFNGKDKREFLGKIRWLGFRDRYFCSIIQPQFESENASLIPDDPTALAFSFVPRGTQSQDYEGKIYVGPQDLVLLKSHGRDFQEIMVFSQFGLMDAVAKGLYYFMIFLHRFIPSWGICIILACVATYYATYPLTMKGMSSMKKLQALQPKIKDLQEKHKSNPQKLNKEIMGLYKENKVNPFGGCFPFILQMPFVFGIYQVLWRSISLRGADFLWIKDLSLPDHLFKFPVELPFLGEYFNLLPLIMVVFMVLQQKISAQATVMTDPAHLAQQKMMTTIFPVFIGFLFYKFASGLTLYFTVLYFLTTLTQWKIAKASR